MVARIVKNSPLPSAHSPPPIPNHSHSKRKGNPGPAPAPRSEAAASPYFAAVAPDTPRINAERDTTRPPRTPVKKLPVPPRRVSAIPPDLGSTCDRKPRSGRNIAVNGSGPLLSAARTTRGRSIRANQRRVPSGRRPPEESCLVQTRADILLGGGSDGG